MKSNPAVLMTSTVISLLLIIPFIILELINRPYQNGFPFPLFAFMWLLAGIVIFSVMPFVKFALGRKQITLSHTAIIIRVAVLILSAWMFFGIINDQMPCFLGVPNCD